MTVKEVDPVLLDTLISALIGGTDYNDTAELKSDVVKANGLIEDEEAFEAECIKTFNRDFQNFCAVGYAPVKMAYMQQFSTGIWGNILLLDQAQDQWVAAYKRLVQTEWGLSVITQTRFLVCNWFARMGSPDAGDFDERRDVMFKEWDAWEVEAGGVDGDGKRLSIEVVGQILPNTLIHHEQMGVITAMVMATDSYYEEHKGDKEALAHWPIDQDIYGKDLAYIAKEMQWFNSEKCRAPLFDVLMETYIPLMFHSGRYQKVDGMWVVRRLQKLLEMELPTQEAAVKS